MSDIKTSDNLHELGILEEVIKWRQELTLQLIGDHSTAEIKTIIEDLEKTIFNPKIHEEN